MLAHGADCPTKPNFTRTLLRKCHVEHRLLTGVAVLIVIPLTLLPGLPEASPALSSASPSARVRAWSGLIDPSRAIDWSSAGAKIVNHTTQCGSTIVAYGGTATTINNAIAACKNGYVLLGPGTFTLSTGIAFYSKTARAEYNNVTLRGSGPTQTILDFTGFDTCDGIGGAVCATTYVETWYGSPEVQYGTGSQTARWIAGYAQGTTQITLSRTNGLSPGMTIFLDQLDDASDTRGVYVCQLGGHPGCSQEGSEGQGRPGNGSRTRATSRGQLEMKQITAVNGNVVTISPGLYNTNWRASQEPGAWWINPMLTGVGIENLSIDLSRIPGPGPFAAIMFTSCHDCWVKNIRSVDAYRDHIMMYQSSNVTVRDSYFYGSRGGVNSYGIEVYGGTEELFENNIIEENSDPFIYGSMSGSIIAYNFDTSIPWPPTNSFLSASHDEHGGGNSFNLFEGNESVQFDSDDFHGTHNQETLFRNWFKGTDVLRQVDNTVPILLTAYSRDYNVIGNVLGTPGYHTNYENRCDIGSPTRPNRSIYVLGYCDHYIEGIRIGICATSAGTMLNDSLTPTTLYRWGNYDVATRTVRWDPSEVPTKRVSYVNGNSVPASRSLPVSFYLTSKPAWWGIMPWPAIGPDVTGGMGPGGHAYNIPAEVCYKKLLSQGTNRYKSYDSRLCYPTH